MPSTLPSKDVDRDKYGKHSQPDQRTDANDVVEEVDGNGELEWSRPDRVHVGYDLHESLKTCTLEAA